MSVYESLKNITLIALFFYCAPSVVQKLHARYIYLAEQKTKIGVIQFTGSFTSSSPITDQIHDFFADPAVKGIVLFINSCTITPGVAYALFNDITQLKKEHHKPSVAFIENHCRTESYLVACATDQIIAPETALIECDMQDTVQEGGTQLASHNEINKIYIKLIATARKLSLTTPTEWAHGTFTGHHARIIKLIDQTGSWHTIISFLQQKALIVGTIDWVIPPRPCNCMEYLSHIIFGNNQTIIN